MHIGKWMTYYIFSGQLEMASKLYRSELKLILGYQQG